MKKIKIIETALTNSHAPEGFTLNYRREFLRMIETIPEGATASQMGVAIKIADKLTRCDLDHYVFLEDAEWKYLCDKATAARFGLVAPEIVAMVEAVQNAEECEAPHLTEGKQQKARA